MLSKMAQLFSVYTGVKAYRNANNSAKWAEQNKGTWEMVANARELYRQWLKDSRS